MPEETVHRNTPDRYADALGVLANRMIRFAGTEPSTTSPEAFRLGACPSNVDNLLNRQETTCLLMRIGNLIAR
jgi:hypothetical protein